MSALNFRGAALNDVSLIFFFFFFYFFSPPKPKFRFIFERFSGFLIISFTVFISAGIFFVSRKQTPAAESHFSPLMALYNPLCVFLSTMYIFGGFSGLLLNDVLAYTPPSCQAFSNPALCATAGPGLRCHWGKNKCVPWEAKPPDQMLPAPFCPARPGASHWAPAARLSLCHSSMSVTFSLFQHLV